MLQKQYRNSIEIIEAVKKKLNAQTGKPIRKRVVIKFLFVTLTYDNSNFNSINYLQKKVEQWEPFVHHPMQTFSWERLNRHIFIRISEIKTITYLRYIGDLFFIWKRTKEKLLSFIEDLNKKHPSIKFNFKYSKTEIEVLDTKIYKDTNGKLCLTIFHKPTDRKNYLHFKSAHSPSLKKSIPYSKALHISNI